MPGNYIASLNTGCGLSGFTTSIAKAFVLILFPTDDNPKNPNYFRGAMLYFMLGAVVLVFSISLIVSFAQTKYYAYHIHNKRELLLEEEDSSHHLQVENTPTETTHLEEKMLNNTENQGSFSYLLGIHNQLAIPGYGIIIVYVQTFFVFPAVMLQGKIGFISNISWQVWFIITLFNFTDTLSRYLQEKYAVLNSNTAAIATL